MKRVFVTLLLMFFAIKSNAGALLPINATTLRFLCRGDSNPATAAKGPEP